MPDTPLNPDGVTAAQDALWNSGIGAQLRLMNEDCKIMSEIVLRAYLAVTFNNDTAPALALAILEAAGVEARSIPSARIGTSEHLSDTTYELSTYIEKQQRATAEAKEQAELEAEALELCNEYVRSTDAKPYDSWEDIVRVSKRMAENWLAVARRAREMRAEK